MTHLLSRLACATLGHKWVAASPGLSTEVCTRPACRGRIYRGDARTIGDHS